MRSQGNSCSKLDLHFFLRNFRTHYSQVLKILVYDAQLYMILLPISTQSGSSVPILGDVAVLTALEDSPCEEGHELGVSDCDGVVVRKFPNLFSTFRYARTSVGFPPFSKHSMALSTVQFWGAVTGFLQGTEPGLLVLVRSRDLGIWEGGLGGWLKSNIVFFGRALRQRLSQSCCQRQGDRR